MNSGCYYNSPWECPRCKRMNAPFNPTCFCSPEKQQSALERMINDQGAKGQAEFRPMELPAGLPYGYKKSNTCSICNGRHIHGVDCMTLKVKT